MKMLSLVFRSCLYLFLCSNGETIYLHYKYSKQYLRTLVPSFVAHFFTLSGFAVCNPKQNRNWATEIFDTCN